MKRLVKTLLAVALLITPSVAFADGLTGKTLTKSFKTNSISSVGMMPAHMLSSESTPCYAIDQVSDLDDLIDLGYFFGLGMGDSNPILNVQALGTTEIAASLLLQGFDEATIEAFLRAQLKFIYDCD